MPDLVKGINAMPELEQVIVGVPKAKLPLILLTKKATPAVLKALAWLSDLADVAIVPNPDAAIMKQLGAKNSLTLAP